MRRNDVYREFSSAERIELNRLIEEVCRLRVRQVDDHDFNDRRTLGTLFDLAFRAGEVEYVVVIRKYLPAGSWRFWKSRYSVRVSRSPDRAGGESAGAVIPSDITLAVNLDLGSVMMAIHYARMAIQRDLNVNDWPF